MRLGSWAVLAAALLVAGCSSPGASAAAWNITFGGGPAGPRPSDACSMLTSDEVEFIVGTPGPFTGAHEDPDASGKPVWGCTWGTPLSYADVREMQQKYFDGIASDSDYLVTPLHGIGTVAMLARHRSDGLNPYVYFAVGGRYYRSEVDMNRHPESAVHATQEAAETEVLAATIARWLAH